MGYPLDRIVYVLYKNICVNENVYKFYYIKKQVVNIIADGCPCVCVCLSVYVVCIYVRISETVCTQKMSRGCTKPDYR